MKHFGGAKSFNTFKKWVESSTSAYGEEKHILDVSRRGKQLNLVRSLCLKTKRKQGLSSRNTFVLFFFFFALS